MRHRILVLGLFLTAAIFVCDITLPEWYHFEYLYGLVILLSIWIPGNRNTFDAGVVMTGLIIMGYYFNHDRAPESNELSSIAIPAASVWAFTYVISLFKLEEEKSMKSTKHLHAMFANATEGIIISNAKGEIVMMNPVSEQLLGYAHNELIGSRIERLVPGRFSHHHVAHRNKYNADLRTRPMGKGMSLYAQRKDGSEFPVEISLSNFRINDELFIISFLIDITERKAQELLIAKTNEELEERVAERTRELAEANRNLKLEMTERSKIEEALRDSERLYSTIAHNFPNGWIVVLDRQFRRVFIDGKELQELGVRREQFIGQSAETKELLPFTPEVKRKLLKVFEWESLNFDVTYEERTYEVHAVPLPDLKGHVREILLVVQNVTGIREAERDILESLEKEKQLNDMKSKFVSIASHEFRTPLSTILSSVSLAEKYAASGDEAKRTRHFDRIRSAVKNLTEILNDFLSLEKLEAGKIDSHPSEFDIVAFAEDITEEMQTLARPGQDIRYSHRGATRQVHLDKQLLRNICINLINNAIKYSPEGKPIEFFTEIGQEITLSVRDFGIGIPKADQQHLFERFFRAQNVTAIQGTGLGLNIVNRYATLMNGRVEYRSEENEGSEFVVKFAFSKTPDPIQQV
jgi:PAS domain S-box-containing protein